jgi:hypothetical protein
LNVDTSVIEDCLGGDFVTAFLLELDASVRLSSGAVLFHVPADPELVVNALRRGT